MRWRSLAPSPLISLISASSVSWTTGPVYVVQFPADSLSISATDKRFWSRLWKFRVPQRANHFAWRFVIDSLPTSANLLARTMQVSQTCPLCNEENGTSAHLFFTCEFAFKMWTAAGLLDLVRATQFNRGELWFKHILSVNETNTAELMLMMCDALWTQKNQRIFTDKTMEAEFIAVSVAANLRRFHEANSWPERTSDDLAETSLLRPLPGGSRVLFDASVKDGKAGLAAVALEEDGSFIKALSSNVPEISDPLFAEALALSLAFDLANELETDCRTVAGDCPNLVRMVRDMEPPTVTCHNLVEELKRKIVESDKGFPCWIPRNSNNLADSLAGYAREQTVNRLEWNTFPTFFLSNDSGRFPVT